jgi:hypothetical protein
MSSSALAMGYSHCNSWIKLHNYHIVIPALFCHGLLFDGAIKARGLVTLLGGLVFNATGMGADMVIKFPQGFIRNGALTLSFIYWE